MSLHHVMSQAGLPTALPGLKTAPKGTGRRGPQQGEAGGAWAGPMSKRQHPGPGRTRFQRRPRPPRGRSGPGRAHGSAAPPHLGAPGRRRGGAMRGGAGRGSVPGRGLDERGGVQVVDLVEVEQRGQVLELLVADLEAAVGQRVDDVVRDARVLGHGQHVVAGAGGRVPHQEHAVALPLQPRLRLSPRHGPHVPARAVRRVEARGGRHGGGGGTHRPGRGASAAGRAGGWAPASPLAAGRARHPPLPFLSLPAPSSPFPPRAPAAARAESRAGPKGAAGAGSGAGCCFIPALAVPGAKRQNGAFRGRGEEALPRPAHAPSAAPGPSPRQARGAEAGPDPPRRTP